MNAIEVEGLSKMYRLGYTGTGNLKDDVAGWWAKMRGKPNPNQLVGAVNDRTDNKSDGYVYALNDINFNVEHGEVLGIIGKNGAGKSTLLKILTKITGPTTGNIKMKGRVGSLLEVGTGFNPELSGRENIYLNGAILGMRKKEIDAKFFDIVEFAGVAKYIDTPVKRYSSGMGVRLGFAVAAFLEPEILIIDEVLAVGDADFQSRAIGKMQEISNESKRTVLFVSHNMASIKTLCSRAVLLKDGQLIDDGHPDTIVERYLSLNTSTESSGAISKEQNKTWADELFFTNVSLNAGDDRALQQIHYRRPINIQIEFNVLKKIIDGIIVVGISTREGSKIVFLESHESLNKLLELKEGEHTVNVDLPLNLLPGRYLIWLAAFHENGRNISHVDCALNFEVIKVGQTKEETYKWNPIHGMVRNQTKWEITKL
ncbi:MAG: ABC transporter ATP-binding protein [Bacteroidetes bacterium]|nr:ABC transporter ATP-binding protein [Bacteroidota bacterium]